MNNRQKIKYVHSCLGSSAHSKYERQKDDFYSTDPSAISMLHKHELLDKDVPYWETACGNGNLSKELSRLGYEVLSTDLFDRGYGHSRVDFFQQTNVFPGNTITNPPYKYITEWILHSLEITANKVYIFCKIQTLETVGRYENVFKHNPPSLVCPFVKRVKCYKDGVTKNYNSAVCYAWFIWDNKDNSGETKVKWLI